MQARYATETETCYLIQTFSFLLLFQVMAKEYKVGMVAEFLGGGKPSPGGKLANFFSSPSSVATPTASSSPKKAKTKSKTKEKVRIILRSKHNVTTGCRGLVVTASECGSASNPVRVTWDFSALTWLLPRAGLHTVQYTAKLRPLHRCIFEGPIKDWNLRAKQLSQGACVSEALKCWGAWNAIIIIMDI